MECMNKCTICGKEYEATRSTSKYCGVKCRKLAFQQKDKVSVPELSVPDTITDACGAVHRIDYESRRANAKLLGTWVQGKGSEHQQDMGSLAMQYSVINGFRKPDGSLTAQGKQYMGMVV